MLYKIKLVLSLIDDKSDAIIQLMIDDTVEAVLDYCNRKDLPLKLESLVREIVVNQFQFQNEGNVNSIKRGDISTTYNKPIGIETFTGKQINRLNRYRSVRVI